MNISNKIQIKIKIFQTNHTITFLVMNQLWPNGHLDLTWSIGQPCLIELILTHEGQNEPN